MGPKNQFVTIESVQGSERTGDLGPTHDMDSQTQLKAREERPVMKKKRKRLDGP